MQALGSVHYPALIKQTHQCISILSHRLLGAHSSGALITPVLDSGKALSHALQMVLPPHRAQEWLENHPSPAELWGGTCVPLLHLPDSAGILGISQTARNSPLRHLQYITWK